ETELNGRRIEQGGTRRQEMVATPKKGGASETPAVEVVGPTRAVAEVGAPATDEQSVQCDLEVSKPRRNGDLHYASLPVPAFVTASLRLPHCIARRLVTVSSVDYQGGISPWTIRESPAEQESSSESVHCPPLQRPLFRAADTQRETDAPSDAV